MDALRVDIGQVKEDHAEVSNRVEYQGKFWKWVTILQIIRAQQSEQNFKLIVF